MQRFAISAAALVLSSVLAGGAAHADRGFSNGGGFHQGGGFHHDGGFRHDGGFHHDHDGRFHHHHHFFRPFFFFGTAVFAPVPLAVYPLPYPAYIYAPVEGYPSCYQYQTTVVIDGQLLPAWGTACLQPDGTWRAFP